MTDINIKIKTTYSPEIKTVTVKSDGKVEDIMKEIEKYSNIPPDGQKLIFKGKILKPEEPISTYKIENDVTLIMVKTVKTESAKPQVSAPSSTTTNNVSSNPEDNITLKVKTNLDGTIHSVPINKNATVLGLKGEIEKVTHVPPDQQKLVNKGITMKDSDPISTYGLANDSTIAMIKTAGAQQGGIPNLGGLGGMPNLGGLGGLGNLGGLGGMPNPGQLNNPQIQQAMQAILNNPEMLNQLLNSPEMRPLLEQNPQLRQILQNPQARQLLFNPQLLGQLGGSGGLEGLGGQGGGSPFGDLENISVSQTPNTRLGELFTQWMNEEKNGGVHNSGSSQPRPQPAFGGEQPRLQPVFQQFPQPDPNVDYKEKYKDQIAQIKEMGIDDEEKIIEALKKCDGNIQYALNRLFG